MARREQSHYRVCHLSPANSSRQAPLLLRPPPYTYGGNARGKVSQKAHENISAQNCDQDLRKESDGLRGHPAGGRSVNKNWGALTKATAGGSTCGITRHRESLPFWF